jgi:hypothetical protein
MINYAGGLTVDAGAAQVLLPQGLTRLLQIAAGEGVEDCWPRVHAFNVLRMVLNDSSLAVDTSGAPARPAGRHRAVHALLGLRL